MDNNICCESIIGRRIWLVYNELYKKISSEMHASCYKVQHETYSADAEFAGKYMDISSCLYAYWGDQKALKNAAKVARNAIDYQRQDGYLGTYHSGMEFENYSVWNQAHTCIGLLAYYLQSGNEEVLHAVEKCIDYNADCFMSHKADILRSGNQGSEHLVLLVPIMQLYRITKKEKCVNFARYILDTCQKNPCFDFLSNPSALGIASQKGIEMLCFMLGVLEYAEQTEDQRYLEAVEKYWESINKDQIIQTGCGTVSEAWRPHGNTPAMLPVEINPNENCVAVGWMELSAKLYSITRDGRYFDAFEKTLYNHLFGSMAPDGSDFAYYQGNYGVKIIATKPTAYSCCRYRGLHMFTHLPELTVLSFENSVYLPLYTTFNRTIFISGVAVDISMTTEYPRNGKIQLSLKSVKPISISMHLRLPDWCKEYQLFEGETNCAFDISKGHLVWHVSLSEEVKTYTLQLTLPMNVENAEVGSQKVVAYTYGPVLLATDSYFGETLYSTTIDKGAIIKKVGNCNDRDEILRFETSGTIRGIPHKIHLIDYASAGMKSPGKDYFRVWIPLTENENISKLW